VSRTATGDVGRLPGRAIPLAVTTQPGTDASTIRRWIWSGRLPAVKKGASYRIDIVHLQEVVVELQPESGSRGSAPDSMVAPWLLWA
jgi:hypothetical protein